MEREVSPGIYIIDRRAPQQRRAMEEEREVMPGVHLTEPAEEQKSHSGEKEFALPLPQMMDEMKEITNSIEHLKRSNEELREALEEDPTDQDFQLAIRENEEVIARKNARFAALDKMVKEACKHVNGSSTDVGASAQTQQVNEGKQPSSSAYSASSSSLADEDGDLYL